MQRPLEHLRLLSAQYLRELERNELFVAWRSLEQAIEIAERQLGQPGQRTEPIPRTSEDRGQHGTTAKLAIRIIETFGRPMSTLELLDEMRKVGHEFTGQHPAKNLASVFSKSGSLASVQIGPNARDDRAWWIVGRHHPLIRQDIPLNGDGATKHEGPA